tara:strand:- start:107 stop:373 length:267 start_codon:yes stop_codon:yes gene_type:complete
MNKYDDITLIRFAEGKLSEQEEKQIRIDREDEELNSRLIKFEKAINLLREFAKTLDKKKKYAEKKTEKLSSKSNLLEISDFFNKKNIG